MNMGIKIVKSDGLNRSEKLSSLLCEKAFLNVWTYPNIYKTSGKELADIVVFLDNDILLFSIKEYEKHPPFIDYTEWKRWYKMVIKKSVNQLNGAERWIRDFPDKIYTDRKSKEKIPFDLRQEKKEIHKFIVAFDSPKLPTELYNHDLINSKVIINYSKQSFVDVCNNGHGSLCINPSSNIHFYDEKALRIVLKELNTASDFLDFLTSKKSCLNEVDELIYSGEENLIAEYYRNFCTKKKKHYIYKKTCPTTKPIKLMIDRNNWDKFSRNKSYLSKKEADKPSYIVDKLIHKTGRNILNGSDMGNSLPFRGKSGICILANMSRFNRRRLGSFILENSEIFPNVNADRPYRLNAATIIENIGYVFLQLQFIEDLFEYDDYRNLRAEMLKVSMGVFKHKNPKLEKIVGISCEPPKFTNKLISEEIFLIDNDVWCKKLEEYCLEQNKMHNFFSKKQMHFHVRHDKMFPNLNR